ncbi:MAG: NUDIX hydrolase [Candidatus Eremiobacteraeota bacterium]|nr:NUDIX hydrolase [Candidatus Eremiobacteraeota bacterium]
MKVHGSERIYSGKVLNLRVDEIDRVGDGTRKVEVVEHVGGVCIIAQPSADEIVLVKQRRHAVGEDLWEAPAGMMERDEPARETARRELLEETGYQAGSLRFLWSMYTVPGYGEERISFFVAEGLTAGAAQPEDDEQFELRTWRLDEAWALVERDAMRDAKTQIALAWACSQRR